MKVASEARTNKTPCKPMEKQNSRLNRGTTVAFHSWLLTSGASPFFSVIPFHARHVPESCSPIDLHSVSLVRAPEESFKIDTIDAMEIPSVGTLLGRPFRRRPFLPRPAPFAALLCAAPPRPARGVSGLGFDKCSMSDMSTEICVSSSHGIFRWSLLS